MTRGMRTISRLPGSPGLGPTGAAGGSGPSPRAALPARADRRAGDRRYTRSRRDKRHPLALAQSLERSLPADKLCAPSTHPALPSRAKFPGPGLDSRSGSGPVFCRPLLSSGTWLSLAPAPFPPSCSSSLSAPVRLWGAPGCGAPPPPFALTCCRPGEGAGCGQPGVSAPPALLLRSRLCSVSRSLLWSSEGLGAAERARLWRSESCKPRPAPSPPAAESRSRRSVASVESLPASAGGGAATSPARPAAQDWQLSFHVLEHQSGSEGHANSECRFTTTEGGRERHTLPQISFSGRFQLETSNILGLLGLGSGSKESRSANEATRP